MIKDKSNKITHKEKKKVGSSFLVNKIEKFTDKMKIETPSTTQDVISTLFKDTSNQYDIIRISKDTYSFCMEYSDISFAKANKDDQESIFLKWVDYLNSFTFKTHVQVVCAGKSVKTEDFKKGFTYDENLDNPNLKKLAEESNNLINKSMGNDENKLERIRYIVVSQKAKSYKEANDIFMDIQLKTEENFAELGSSLHVVPVKEVLGVIYDMLNIDTMADYANDDLRNIAKDRNLTLYDVLAPKEINVSNRDHLVIEDKKFIRTLYVNLPKSATPRFYNKMTSINDMSLITTLNISPTNNAKIIKKVEKKISGMKSERLVKVKRARRALYRYEDVKDEKLEDRLMDAKQLKYDIMKNKQKVFQNNMLICITADSKDILERNTNKIIELAAEQLITIKHIFWQQLEGIQNVLPLGHNNLQFQRSLSSEATAINVPFASKDIMHKNSLYYGINLVSRNSIFCDRKKQLNGNGCILATSGAGKSFSVKFMIEQIILRYPNDEIIIVDPMREYNPMITDLDGQVIRISTNSDNRLNPFDMNEDYELADKIEYIIAWVESIKGKLSSLDISIIDRCAKKLYDEYEKSSYEDNFLPNISLFRTELLNQSEEEAQRIALALERHVDGSIKLFSGKTNVEINKKLVSFDISDLSESMQNTGYLVVLDHIKNRTVENKKKGIYTWLFIDEFHILLCNDYSAEYIAKFYKIGRKNLLMNTIITQNITDVLNNVHGRKILSNSEFAMILKQNPLDLKELIKIFKISKEEANYVRASPAGQGLVMYGNDCYPFRNEVPKDYYIYHLNETSNVSISR